MKRIVCAIVPLLLCMIALVGCESSNNDRIDPVLSITTVDPIESVSGTFGGSFCFKGLNSGESLLLTVEYWENGSLKAVFAFDGISLIRAQLIPDTELSENTF